MTTYFTSDTHFNHVNILKFEPKSRPFATLDEMNAAIIAKYNARVKPNDIVYHLGDFALGQKIFHKGFFDQLNGRKILVIGNHDQKVEKMEAMGWEVHPELTLTVEGVGTVYLRHSPKNDHGADYHLCGHVHSSFDRVKNIINVGVDVRDLEPKTLEELISAPFVGMLAEPHRYKIDENGDLVSLGDY